MNTPTEEDYAFFAKVLEGIDKVPSPEECEALGRETYLMTVRLSALHNFLQKHCSIVFKGGSSPKKWLDGKKFVVRGTSTQGVWFDLHFMWWPDRKEYTLNMDWREDINTIALTPDLGAPIRTEEALSEDDVLYEVSSVDAGEGHYMQGSIVGVKCNTEGFLRLAKKLVEIEDTANR